VGSNIRSHSQDSHGSAQKSRFSHSISTEKPFTVARTLDISATLFNARDRPTREAISRGLVRPEQAREGGLTTF
jgi:hypothetical protein